MEASLAEDPHRTGEIDHAPRGLPIVWLDFKEFIKGKPVHVVIRERACGSTYGVKCLRKGPLDEWAVQRRVWKVENWELRDYELWVKGDGEPALRGLQQAIREARPAGTHVRNSPAQDPQANGVAERAVQ